MTDAERTVRVGPLAAWATPLDAPIYPRDPVAFNDLKLLTLQYRMVDLLEGDHWRADFELVRGRVVHDHFATPDAG